MANDYEKHINYINRSKIIRMLVLSLLLLCSGIMLILGNMGIIDKSLLHYVFSWQSLLIVIGVFLMIRGLRSHWFASFVLISVGTVFLIDEIYAFETKAPDIIWPLLLIILGIGIMIKILISNKHKKCYKNISECGKHSWFLEELSNDDYINVSKVFTGVNMLIRSKNFRGGKASFVFGGGEIDLRQAKLAEGTFVLKLEYVFGGVKIFVPKDWDISIESSGVFGGFSDERRYLSLNEIDKSRKLIIKVEALFGGGEISI
jgi:predicted membrane protein